VHVEGGEGKKKRPVSLLSLASPAEKKKEKGVNRPVRVSRGKKRRGTVFLPCRRRCGKKSESRRRGGEKRGEVIGGVPSRPLSRWGKKKKKQKDLESFTARGGGKRGGVSLRTWLTWGGGKKNATSGCSHGEKKRSLGKRNNRDRIKKKRGSVVPAEKKKKKRTA